MLQYSARVQSIPARLWCECSTITPRDWGQGSVRLSPAYDAKFLGMCLPFYLSV